MSEVQLTLTEEERQFLVTLLETALKEKRVEEHRTRAPSYREHLVKHEELIQGVLSKIRQP